ncbi:MAG TPA: hypothetical protein VMH41_09730 [Mycobacteriales bacterium]|nr:hypothetical protein [Mycobacteriales bacterium]
MQAGPLGGTSDQRKLTALLEASLAGLDDPSLPRAHGRHSVVNITIDLPTLLGLRNNPAEIPGVGPIPASVARRWHRAKTHAGHTYLKDRRTAIVTWQLPTGLTCRIDPYDYRTGP